MMGVLRSMVQLIAFGPIVCLCAIVAGEAIRHAVVRKSLAVTL